tara:strand:- start:65 stop:262 length:198 start_codon:yes stop_codon:yes gene_type:complete
MEEITDSIAITTPQFTEMSVLPGEPMVVITNKMKMNWEKRKKTLQVKKNSNENDNGNEIEKCKCL